MAKSHKHFWVLLLLGGAFILALFFILPTLSNTPVTTDQPENLTTEPTTGPISIDFADATYVIEGDSVMLTAKEALSLAYENAKQVMDEPLFNSITSTDADTDESTPDLAAGQDGKRQNWNISFGDASGVKRINCQIRSGKSAVTFIDERETPSLQKGIYQVDDLVIDSSEVIARAIEEKGIKPGDPVTTNDGIIGYHFSISDTSFDESEESRLAICVTAMAPDSPNSDGYSLYAQVYFDAKTGELLNASKLTGYDAGRQGVWEAF